jgi:hypothetical protein
MTASAFFTAIPTEPEQSERRERIAEELRGLYELGPEARDAEQNARLDRLEAERAHLSESGAVPGSYGERVRENCASWCETNGFPVAAECLRKLVLPAAPISPAPQAGGVREALERAAMECERQRIGPIVSSVDAALIHNGACDKCATAVRTLAALSSVEAGAGEALKYATNLLQTIAEKHYPDRVPEWKPLPELIGVLTQIDNLTSGMTRAALSQSPTAPGLVAAAEWHEQIERRICALEKDSHEPVNVVAATEFDALSERVSELERTRSLSASDRREEG